MNAFQIFLRQITSIMLLYEIKHSYSIQYTKYRLSIICEVNEQLFDCWGFGVTCVKKYLCLVESSLVKNIN